MSFLFNHQSAVRRRTQLVITFLIVTLSLLTMLSLSVGEVWLSPANWLTSEGQLYVGQLRLPRTLAVILVGAALAVSGAVMQALFNNPLAEPGLLGVSSGAGLGVILCILLGYAAPWQLSLSAIIGALVITSLLLGVARRVNSASRLLLTGVALGIVSSALSSWAVCFSSSVNLLQLIYWMMGGFSGIDWQDRWLMVALLPVVIGLTLQGRALNLLSLGNTVAYQLGLPVMFWRSIFVLITGWLVGISVALAGSIGFIGLIIPHIMRLCGVGNYHALLPASALAGAVTLLLADVIARQSLTAAELPVGVVTATLGAPLFIWLLLRNKQ